MIELEKQGVATVIFTAQAFVRDAQQSAKTFGLPNLPLAAVPLPFSNQSAEAIQKMVDDSIEQVIAGLTRPPEAIKSATLEKERFAEKPDCTPEGCEISPHEPLRVCDEKLIYDGADLLEACAEMNRQFLAYGWGDGFPLIPPIEASVEKMLKGVKRPAEEVVAVLEPGFGKATVQKIAINAVMAGCRPEQMPVLIAAVKCLAKPEMYLRNKAMSTGSHAPLMLINGPIVKRLNINSGTCALGPGALSAVNTAIGRALRLIMMNIGHTYPGVSDMDTIGSPTKYSLCVAENEQRSPWEPYHASKGFSKEDSTVTIQFVYGICELYDFANSAPQRLVEVYATATKNVAQLSTGNWVLGRRSDPRYGTDEMEHNFMLICPEHASVFAKAGWSRQDLQEAMYRSARMPFKTIMLNKESKALDAAHPELKWLYDNPDLLIPVVEVADCFEIAVVGGNAGRGAYFYGAGGPVTMPIED
ncbi:MAG: hypothetical protein JRK26_19560 [Deltaproteobacteria bacterium]|nr:hypothetical protein [Deltaproteobacteria bacterium]